MSANNREINTSRQLQLTSTLLSLLNGSKPKQCIEVGREVHRQCSFSSTYPSEPKAHALSSGDERDVKRLGEFMRDFAHLHSFVWGIFGFLQSLLTLALSCSRQLKFLVTLIFNLLHESIFFIRRKLYFTEGIFNSEVY